MVGLTCVLLTGMLADIPLLVAVAIALKLTFYLARRLPRRTPGGRAFEVFEMVRLVGLMVPGAMWSLGVPLLHPLPGAFIAVGELVDRAELYAELRFLDPGLQAERDLRALIGRHRQPPTEPVS
jgi:hypothetical protein